MSKAFWQIIVQHLEYYYPATIIILKSHRDLRFFVCISEGIIGSIQMISLTFSKTNLGNSRYYSSGCMLDEKLFEIKEIKVQASKSNPP